jgi:hypothetical protein
VILIHCVYALTAQRAKRWLYLRNGEGAPSTGWAARRSCSSGPRSRPLAGETPRSIRPRRPLALSAPGLPAAAAPAHRPGRHAGIPLPKGRPRPRPRVGRALSSAVAGGAGRARRDGGMLGAAPQGRTGTPRRPALNTTGMYSIVRPPLCRSYLADGVVALPRVVAADH